MTLLRGAGMRAGANEGVSDTDELNPAEWPFPAKELKWPEPSSLIAPEQVRALRRLCCDLSRFYGPAPAAFYRTLEDSYFSLMGAE